MKKINILLGIVILISGCQGYSVTGGPGKNSAPALQTKSDTSKSLISVNSLLVAPVQADSSVLANIPSNVDLNAMLSDAINQEMQIKIVHAADIKKIKPPSEYLKDAKKLDLDGVLVTRLNHFSMREGSGIGSTNPARVDLVMEIIKAQSATVIWESSFHFKDQALSDNLFKIKERFEGQGAQFRSAQDLLSEGYRTALKDFSQKRIAGFTR